MHDVSAAGARMVALLLALVVATAGCGVEAGEQSRARGDEVVVSGGGTQEDTASTTTTSQPPTDLDIAGSDGSELNDLLGATIVDLEAFWTEAYPEAYGEPYLPLEGGLFAIDSSSDPAEVPCVGGGVDITVVLDNAYYCPPADAVVWDQEIFIPQMAEDYGPFAAATVIAHEWGHVIQGRSQIDEASVILELQADCFAGAWTRRVADGGSEAFAIDAGELDEALAGILSLRDAPGGSADDPSAHGSGFDRVGAFQEGFEDGATRCAEYRNGDPAPYQFPFSDQTEFDSGGDLPLSGSQVDPGILELAFPSLDAYWSATFPELSGGIAWEPLDDPVSFRAGDGPQCDGQPVEDFALFVCIPDRYVGFEMGTTMPSAYEQNGDFAVATLLATQYGLDVVSQLGTADDELAATLQGDCLAGAWAEALLPPDPPDAFELVLSPGDLDEAVAVLLTFRSADDRERQGPGFDRVRAFRRGVLRGPEACLNL
jgi:predicted metalloprotease